MVAANRSKSSRSDLDRDNERLLDRTQVILVEVAAAQPDCVDVRAGHLQQPGLSVQEHARGHAFVADPGTARRGCR